MFLALLAIAGLIGLYLVYRSIWSRTTGYEYKVRVGDVATGAAVPGADVSLVFNRLTPLKSRTDARGYATLSIESKYTNRSGKLIVEASGYDTETLSISTRSGKLPAVVLLRKRSLFY